ncbi:MAG: flagellin, partial [Clostridiales bacterium]|nr:flagellin [Clostridiales bacterium]
MVTNGSTLTIGTKTYTFTTDKNNIGKEGYVDATSGDLATIAKNLTDAVAANNTTYTLGTDATAGHITITEIDGQTDFDLSTVSGIEKSLGFTKCTTSPSNPANALTFQIGDTAEDYNQLKVSIGDIHCAALGIDGISIAKQTDAQAAVQSIKDAINRVSSIRGDLGATQNRLEHTANNLSVMQENITDAESSIRDTDVAEEMMAYTKNNILIQASQAMLAQANQVPQGVLQ